MPPVKVPETARRKHGEPQSHANNQAHARHAKNRNVTKDTAGETQEQGQEILPSTMAAIKAAWQQQHTTTSN